MNKLKIVFFGTSNFGVPALRALFAAPFIEVVAAISTSPKPAGKNRVVASTPITQEAKKLGLKIFESLDADLRPELGIVASYGKILPESTLQIPKYGFLNIHPSLLPKYRGASPIEAAILNGDKETGVTIMQVDAKMDHGPILSQEAIKLRGDEFANELEEVLAKIGADLLLKTIPSYVHGEIVPKEQNHIKAIITKKITREDGRVDLSNDPKEIWRKFRAYHPWPGIWTSLRIKNKELRIKLLDIELANGKIKINKLQPEGKNPMTIDEFARGYKDFIPPMNLQAE